ncbi:diguanylate cyclase domain-containing protein [Amphritea sp. HPY]|uniref:diguanylate cyclase domain-containing protein n=1 Tax=Amphritea sp. HPY TaxID=3421652 RepID=UPI003D7D8AFD
MAEYIVYGDLNCPFSYALHELLCSNNLLHKVDWRLVEHNSEIGSYLGSAESMAELASDVFNIRNRTPDVAISLPLNRSDSYFPCLCVIATQKIDPGKAETFRHNLYRALWVEGKDISNPSVIFNCLEASELPTELDADETCEQILEAWQQQWEQGNFTLRTPAMLAPDGRKLVGLMNHESIINFLQGDSVATPELNSGTRYHERQTIALYGGDSVAELWGVLSTLRDESNILLPQSLQALKDQLLSDEQCPDLVLLHNDGQQHDLTEQCRELGHFTREQQIPLAVIGQPLDDSAEVALYDVGVADYLLQNRDPAIIQSRINILLQLKRSHDLLARAASIDNLTQVFNRREFERTLEIEWRRGQRSKQPLSLILLDIDHFKAFNDYLGHLNGDNCLRQVALAIKESARRAQDIVSRYGGEEFCILLPDTDQSGAQVLANNICNKISQLDIRHSPEFRDQPVTASLGITTMTPNNKGVSPHKLIEQADKALYQAKEQGRNRVICFTAE